MNMRVFYRLQSIFKQHSFPSSWQKIARWVGLLLSLLVLLPPPNEEMQIGSENFSRSHTWARTHMQLSLQDLGTVPYSKMLVPNSISAWCSLLSSFITDNWVCKVKSKIRTTYFIKIDYLLCPEKGHSVTVRDFLWVCVKDQIWDSLGTTWLKPLNYKVCTYRAAVLFYLINLASIY